MRRASRFAIPVVIAAAVSPAGALGATVGKSGSALTYTAAAGETNNLVVSLSGGTYTFEDSGASITAGATCTRVNATRATCPGAGITGVNVDTGNLNDLAWNTSATGSTLTGGDGNDTLIGGGGADVLIACAGDDSEIAGAGADVLLDGFFNCSGGGNDSYDGGTGADGIFGGPGDDTITYSGRSAPVFVSLDDAANDGAAGEGDNVHLDIENVTGGSAADGLSGDSDANTLRGEGGNDSIDGGFGADFFDGGAGNDDLDALDGEIDSVNCGNGFDSGAADFDDVVSPSCEALDLADPFFPEDVPLEEFPGDCFAGPGPGDFGSFGDPSGSGGVGASGGFEADGAPIVDPGGSCPSARLASCSLVRISNRPVDLEAGAVEIKIGLPKAAPAKCKAKLRLDALTAGAGAQVVRQPTIGSEQLALRAGQTKRFEVQINRSGRRLLHGTERLRVRVKVLVRENGELSKAADAVIKVDAGGR